MRGDRKGRVDRDECVAVGLDGFASGGVTIDGQEGHAHEAARVLFCCGILYQLVSHIT